MSSQRYLYRIADHVVGICFSPSESNSIALLPSFAPFRIGEAEEEPLLMLYVEETLEPSKERSLVRTFDTGNGDTVVYQLPDGGYEYIIRDVRNRDCCLLITSSFRTTSMLKRIFHKRNQNHRSNLHRCVFVNFFVE